MDLLKKWFLWTGLAGLAGMLACGAGGDSEYGSDDDDDVAPTWSDDDDDDWHPSDDDDSFPADDDDDFTSDDDDDGPNPGTNLGQGGAQDFGVFRGILEDGGLPLPETLDDMGFFAEHHLDLPPPECGQEVCIHGALGVMNNMINGANCTMMQIGLNTPRRAAEYDRDPLNLAIAVDTSGSMQGQKIQYVQDGLDQMLEVLEPNDLVTLVSYNDSARLLLEAEPASNLSEIRWAIEQLYAGGSTNLHAGLELALKTVDRHWDVERQNRVILLSDGLANVGVTSQDQIEALARSYSAKSINISSIGVGSDFNHDLMKSLGEIGSGNFFFLEDPKAVREVFTEEINSFIIPIAEDVVIEVDAGAGYDLRAVYGTKLSAVQEDRAVISIPSLFIAHRVSDEDNQGGRRGGGGAIVVELIPRYGVGFDDGYVGQIHLTYRDPNGGASWQQSVAIANPYAPGESPVSGHFAGNSVAKAFVMLNAYAGLNMASESVARNDLNGALRNLRPLSDNIRNWLRNNEDEDIQDDLDVVNQFIVNLVAHGATERPNPPDDPWPQD